MFAKYTFNGNFIPRQPHSKACTDGRLNSNYEQREATANTDTESDHTANNRQWQHSTCWSVWPGASLFALLLVPRTENSRRSLSVLNQAWLDQYRLAPSPCHSYRNRTDQTNVFLMVECSIGLEPYSLSGTVEVMANSNYWVKVYIACWRCSR